MKKVNGFMLIFAVVCVGFLQQSCKPKKVLVNTPVEVDKTPEPVKDAPVTTEPVAETKPSPKDPVETAPNYNFKNIQFELDSYVLKTESYAILDQIYREIRKDASVKFNVVGHASVEGSASYNQKLSIDRANAVKIYLVNSGVNSANLITVGRGATEPIASNDSEFGRAQNRRVEIKVIR